MMEVLNSPSSSEMSSKAVALRDGVNSEFLGPISYIHHPSFDDANALATILGPEPEEMDHPDHQCPPPDGSPYIAALRQCLPLSADLEPFLFRKMNYHLAEAERLRREVVRRGPQGSDLVDINNHIKLSLLEKNRLIEGNLRIVIGRAKKLYMKHDLMELVSEGNDALIVAVEKFDFSRGLRFSTYACTLIDRRISKFLRRQHVHGRRHLNGSEQPLVEALADQSPNDQPDLHPADQAERVIDLLPYLGERERQVLESRFGLNRSGQRETLKTVASTLQISIERVRQLEAKALGQLRRLAEATGLNRPY